MKITPYSKNLLLIGLVGLMTLALASPLGADNAVADNAPPVAKANVQEAYGKLPLYFEANQGQTDSRVKFLNRGRGRSLFLTPTEAVLSLYSRPTDGEGQGAGTTRHPSPGAPIALPAAMGHGEGQGEGAVLRMQFAGANSEARITGLDKLPGIVNYFIGKDP